MADETSIVKLTHNVFIHYNIELITGLAIGGSDTGIQIGGVDKVVIRNPLSKEPYIPGSSLRGKIRSSLEKALGLPLNVNIGSNVRIHGAKTEQDYAGSPVLQLFGVTGEHSWSRPSRLLVRDTRLSDTSRNDMNAKRLDLPYTEVKMEVAIDRITSAANPRSLERVPAGAIFGRGEMVLSIFEGDSANDNRHLFNYLLIGMQLVEDSYLGGSGSRGSGQIRFRNIEIGYRATLENGQIAYGQYHTVLEKPDLSEINTASDLPNLLGAGV
jgi:CRISPR-associated protein Csm3